MLTLCSSEELTEWQALFRLKDQEADVAKHGEVIVHDGNADDEDDEEEDSDGAD